MSWKPAKKKLTKSQKRRGAELRENVDWLENKLRTNPQQIADDVEIKHGGEKLTIVRIQSGRLLRLERELASMRQELLNIYS